MRRIATLLFLPCFFDRVSYVTYICLGRLRARMAALFTDCIDSIKLTEGVLRGFLPTREIAPECVVLIDFDSFGEFAFPWCHEVNSSEESQ